MQKKDDKVGNKTANKEEKEEKKRAREKDQNRFAILNFGFCECVKTKKLFNYVRFSRKTCLFSYKTRF